MQVRPKKKAPPKGQPKMQPSVPYSFPAPIRGIIANENLSMPAQGGAEILDNWICTTTGVKPRGGTATHIPLGDAIKAMFVYRSGSAEIAFGATETDIYPITATSLTTPAAVVSSQTGGNYSTEQFGTAGGDFLYAVNGSDKAQLFDGLTWLQVDDLSTPAITGIATDLLSNVWSFANRLFFVEKDTLNAWYLPVDSIGGAAQVFSLAGIFKKGGALLFGATWSLDAGDGLDDKCVFVSDQGEVAIYEGTNPGSAADWRKAGVYSITEPLGPKAKMQAGGDLLIATRAGLVPLSQAIQRDTAALAMGSVTRTITPIWQAKAFELGAGFWEIEKWASENIIIVSQPGDNERTCLICNLQTGAWTRFTGLNVQTLAYFDGAVFFAGADGNVRRFEVGGNDDGLNYTCVYLGKPDPMGAQGVQKTVVQMRATFRLSTPIEPQISAAADYSTAISSPPNSTPDDPDASVWGLGVWGVAKWGGGAELRTMAVWTAIGRTGFAIAPELQITFGNITKPDVELVSIDAAMHIGALVT